MDDLVEGALRRAALWDEIKDDLDRYGFDLSGGQQQRLSIARAIAVQPEVLLFDEPCASIDPISSAKIEQTIDDLKRDHAMVIVTHNLQVARSADSCRPWANPRQVIARSAIMPSLELRSLS